MLERIDSIGLGAIVAPGIVALLLLLLFTYLYRQTRDPFFGLWKLAAACYAVSFALNAFAHVGGSHAVILGLSHVFFVATALAALVSTRMLSGGPVRVRWPEAALGAAALLWVGVHEVLAPSSLPAVEIGIGGVLVFCAARFFRHARRRDLVSFRLVAAALASWALVLVAGHWNAAPHALASGVDFLLGSLPLVLLGVSMLMVLLENERRVMQENLLAFSSLDLDSGEALAPAQVEPVLQRLVERLMSVVQSSGGALCVSDPWRNSLPSVVCGLSPEFLQGIDSRGTLEFLTQMANGRGGIAVITEAEEAREALAAPGQAGRLEDVRELLAGEGLAVLIVLTLQTRERGLGVLLLAQPAGWTAASSHVRLLLALSMQIAMTLENYVLMDQAQRRTREHELLTQIGQAISSRLDPDEVLRTIHSELGRLFDTRTFYVAFLEGDEVHFELQVEEGETVPKRVCRTAAGLTEHIVRTGQPLLFRSEAEAARTRLGAVPQGRRPARSFCGVPILLNNRPVGVMAALSYDADDVYSERDLAVMQTAAGQVSVAMENARLFAEEQRRARHLGFLNVISRAAISSQDAEQMLSEIVLEIQSNFRFDHIGIGLLHYAAKEVEIKAEAGTVAATTVGKRIPLGSGVMGRVARSGELVLLQGGSENLPSGILPGCRSLLCIPITYGQKMMGVLNVESMRDNAFAPQEVMILRTLADLLATALHNALVLQRLQQQSITDGLTGIKTRRFFLEALQSEWKRAARSGRPFSVVLMDLDKFKEVNDTAGHLEGDLVLARVGRLLEQKCRQSNVVARYGGDEFVILMPETGVEQAQVLSERLRLWLATDPLLNERGITGSFGVATFPLHGATVEDIIRVADAGMYVSKHAGGNRVATAEEFIDTESAAAQKQVISAYVQRFVQSESQGPESAEELVATLRRLGASIHGSSGERPLRDAIAALARAAETREAHAVGHAEAVARCVEAMGRELALGDQELEDLIYAARVHDIGKIVIPEAVLNKSSDLDAEELAMMRMHPAVGAQILETIPGSANIRQYVHFHHERLDGSGYPNGLQGEEIPQGARILAVAEAYVNMRTDRPYASARTPAEAASELESVSGVQLDGMLVRILLRHIKQERAAQIGK